MLWPSVSGLRMEIWEGFGATFSRPATDLFVFLCSWRVSYNLHYSRVGKRGQLLGRRTLRRPSSEALMILRTSSSSMSWWSWSRMYWKCRCCQHPHPLSLLTSPERLVIYCQTSSVSAAHATHCATYCTPCRPLLRAFSGWILTPPPTTHQSTFNAGTDTASFPQRPLRGRPEIRSVVVPNVLGLQVLWTMRTATVSLFTLSSPGVSQQTPHRSWKARCCPHPHPPSLLIITLMGGNCYAALRNSDNIRYPQYETLFSASARTGRPRREVPTFSIVNHR